MVKIIICNWNSQFASQITIIYHLFGIQSTFNVKIDKIGYQFLSSLKYDN